MDVNRTNTALVMMCLLIICVKSAPVPASPYPPEWEHVPASVQDFPVREVQGKNVTVIDPWLYQDRLGMYKVLVEGTKSYFSDWGFNNSGNILWGLPLQLGWQMSSGRLRDMTASQVKFKDTIHIATSSWWANMNYFLSVLPFLGALNSGILDPLKYPVLILKPNGSSVLRDRFCTSVTECESRHPEVINRWTQFFKFVRSGHGIGLREVYEQESRDKTLEYLWTAHTTSLHEAEPIFKDHLALLAVPEMHFGRGWAQLVDFIAACHFQTNLNNTHEQQIAALPPRILHNGDKPPFIPNLTKKQNLALEVINLQYDAQQLTRGGLLYLWQKAMCSEKGRADGRDLLENLLERPIRVGEDLIKIVVDFARDHNC